MDIELARMKDAVRKALPDGAGDFTITSVARAAVEEARNYRELLTKAQALHDEEEREAQKVT